MSAGLRRRTRSCSPTWSRCSAWCRGPRGPRSTSRRGWRPSRAYANPAMYGTGRAESAARAEGRDRQHRALELPVRPRHGAADRRARRGQPGHHQAVRVHAGVRRAAARADARDVRPRSGRRRGRRPRARAGVPRCAGTTCSTRAVRASGARWPRRPPRTSCRSRSSSAASAR